MRSSVARSGVSSLSSGAGFPARTSARADRARSAAGPGLARKASSAAAPRSMTSGGTATPHSRASASEARTNAVSSGSGAPPARHAQPVADARVASSSSPSFTRASRRAFAKRGLRRGSRGPLPGSPATSVSAGSTPTRLAITSHFAPRASRALLARSAGAKAKDARAPWPGRTSSATMSPSAASGVSTRRRSFGPSGGTSATELAGVATASLPTVAAATASQPRRGPVTRACVETVWSSRGNASLASSLAWPGFSARAVTRSAAKPWAGTASFPFAWPSSASTPGALEAIETSGVASFSPSFRTARTSPTTSPEVSAAGAPRSIESRGRARRTCSLVAHFPSGETAIARASHRPGPGKVSWVWVSPFSFVPSPTIPVGATWASCRRASTRSGSAPLARSAARASSAFSSEMKTSE